MVSQEYWAPRQLQVVHPLRTPEKRFCTGCVTWCCLSHPSFSSILAKAAHKAFVFCLWIIYQNTIADANMINFCKIVFLCCLFALNCVLHSHGWISLHSLTSFKAQHPNLSKSSTFISVSPPKRCISPDPNEYGSLNEYRQVRIMVARCCSLFSVIDDCSLFSCSKAVLNVLREETKDKSRLGGRELLELIVKKWGVAYDIQLRKSKPFGEASKNIYVNIMWRYFGQSSFPMDEREYLEHLEAIGQYISSINKVTEFKQRIAESRKRPNAYFGYAVSIPLDVDPDTADRFFSSLPYEWSWETSYFAINIATLSCRHFFLSSIPIYTSSCLVFGIVAITHCKTVLIFVQEINTTVTWGGWYEENYHVQRR